MPTPADAANPHAGPIATLLGVRREERAPLLLAFAWFFCVLAGYYVLRPIRDAMGIAGGVDDLPWLFGGTLAATLLVAPLFAMLVARLPRRRFVTWSYRAMSACLVGFFAALAWLPESAQLWIGRAFYLWISVFNLFVVSLFWAVMADSFRTPQAKRLFAAIAAGGTAGGLVGGAVTATLAERVGEAPLLLVSVLLLEAALVCMRALSRRRPALAEAAGAPPDAVIGGDAWAGFRHVLRSPYLLGICAFMLLYTIGSTFLYFLQAEVVSAAVADRAARTALFARIDVWVNALTLAIQLGLAGRVLRAIGVGWTLALLPLASVIGFGWLATSPVLATVVVFQVVRRTMNFALSRPAREVLFVPLSREDKYKAKNVIDTFVYRGGDQVGAWSYAALGALGLGLAGIAWVAVPLSAAWLVLALWLGRRQCVLAAARERAIEDRSAVSVPTPTPAASSPAP